MMQSAKHIAYRVFQLVFSIIILGLAAGLHSQAGPFAAIPRILQWILFLAFAGALCALLGLIPATTTTTMPSVIPVIFDIIMTLLFLITAIVLTAKVGLKSCKAGNMKTTTNSFGYAMHYPDMSRFWTPTIVMGNAGDGYIHTKSWEKRCETNRALCAFLILAAVPFLFSAIFSVSRYMKQRANPDGLVTDAPRFGPRQPKDDLVVVPEVKEVA